MKTLFTGVNRYQAFFPIKLFEDVNTVSEPGRFIELNPITPIKFYVL